MLEQIVAPADNVQAVITNNLVLFRSVPELQHQNQQLLKIVRDLGDKLEAEEKEYRDTLDQEQAEAIQEAHDAIKLLQEQLENQKKTADISIQARQKECETLKALLQKERATRTVNGVNGHESSSGTDVSEELAEIQTQFEAYKTEMGVDSVRLREDVLTAQREASTLGASLAKANAQIEYLKGMCQHLHHVSGSHDSSVQSVTSHCKRRSKFRSVTFKLLPSAIKTFPTSTLASTLSVTVCRRTFILLETLLINFATNVLT